MGFTYQIPHLIWEFHWDLPIIGIPLAEGGYNIDIGFGLRLPVQNVLEYPEIMVIGSQYPLFTSLTGLDWTASDFANAGLLPDENEFLCKFIVNLWLNILTVEDFDVDINIDESRSFITPIGLGDTFSLPAIQVPLNPVIESVIGIPISSFVDLTLEIEPNLGSNKITATWKAENGAYGTGSLTWHYNDERLQFNIQTHNVVSQAKITLSDFRYWFTVFKLDFILDIDFKGLIGALPDFEIPLFTLDLSDIIGSIDLSMGEHEYTIGSITVNVNLFVIPESPLGSLSIMITMIASIITFLRAQNRIMMQKH